MSIITRAFGADGYGIWSQAMLTASLLMPLVTFNLSASVVRFIGAETDSERRASQLAAVVLIVAVGGIVVFALGCSVAGGVSRLMFGTSDYSWVVFAFLFMFLVRGVYAVALAGLQSLSRFALHAVVSTSQIILDIGAVVWIALASGGSLFASILGIAGVDALLTTAMLVALMRAGSLRLPVRWKGMSRFLRYSLPLIPATSLFWVVNSSDRYVIVHVVGLGDTGAYSAAYQLCRLLALVSQPIVFVLLPLVAGLWENGHRERVRQILSLARRAFYLAAIPATAGLLLVGPEALRILGASHVTVAFPVLALLILGGLLVGLYSIEVLVIYLHEETWLLAAILGLLAAFNLGANLLLVPRIGMLGAAASTAVTYALQWVVVRVLAQRRLPIPIGLSTLWRAMAATAIMAFSVWAIPLPSGALAVLAKTGVGLVAYSLTLVVLRGVPIAELRDALGLTRPRQRW